MFTPSTKMLCKALLCFAVSGNSYAVDLVVTNTADSGDGSLRAVIAGAIGGDIISFDPTLDNATITLTTGTLTITDLELTIDASSLPSGISISGNNSSRVLSVTGDSAKVTLSNLTFRNGRVVDQNGGGVFVESGIFRMTASQVLGCVATYNGGGIYMGISVNAEIDRCGISGNSTGAAGYGAGIFVGGTQVLKISNSQISGNSSSFGGGIACFNSSPQITNCTIQGNAGGGILSGSSSAPVIKNSIVWGNTASGGTLASKQLRNSSGTHPSVTFSLVEGASGSASFGDGSLTVWGAGNLNGALPANAPLFVAPVSASLAPSNTADLRLLAASPGINVGSNSFNTTPLDRSELPRIQEVTVDLGAFEGGYTSFATLYPLLDPEGDENMNGYSNCLEYSLGVDPTGQLAPDSLPRVSTIDNQLFLTSVRRINGFDLKSAWEISSTLDSGSWQTMALGTNYDVETTSMLSPGRQEVVFRLLDSGPVKFFRQRFSK